MSDNGFPDPTGTGDVPTVITHDPQVYRHRAVPVPPHTGITAAAVGATLVTNQMLIDVLHGRGIPSDPFGGAYRYVNIFNPALPIRWQQDSRRYTVQAGFEDHPVAGVSWIAAALVAEAIGGRLPTLTERQVIARSGDDRRYPWGDDPPDPSAANFGEFYGMSTPVATFTATPWGLYDVAGNMDEWCSRHLGERTEDWVPAAEYPVTGGAWNKEGNALECNHSRQKWGRIGTVGIGFRVVFDE